jgi:hypothetical protein
MDNPFLKRATEYFRDEEAFIAVLSPEPIRYFLRDNTTTSLYERLVNFRGTPGSGKTTLARVFEYPTLSALLRNSSISTYRPLLDTMTRCGAVVDGKIAVLGCRLALETDYRDLWEFPYADNVKLTLTNTLIQARAVLAWIRHLQNAGYPLESIAIEARSDADAATLAMGGTNGKDILDKARSIERALYKVLGSLVVPSLEELDQVITDTYRPFDVIDRFSITVEGETTSVRPLAILDDAHVLAPAQFRGLQRQLIRREIRVARWILARLDVLHPKEAFEALTEDRPDDAPMPGITASRDYLSIMLQSGADDRRRQRMAFRRMATDMAARYLRQMPIFSTRNLSGLQNLLGDQIPTLPRSKLDALTEAVESARRRVGVNSTRFQEVAVAVDSYTPQGLTKLPDDVRLGMIAVLLHRMEKRGQASLFEDHAPEPASTVPKVDVSVYDAARIQLMHRYGRPYYVGIDDVCDASSENAEQFLRLAADLVELAAVNVIRGKAALLEPSAQQQSLRDKAERVIDGWDFPRSRVVRKLVDALAAKCLQRTLEPNASLGPGANAYGVLQEDFEKMPETHPDLAQLLQASIANNALTVVPHYNCKNKEWCLLELGGMVILRHGLTLKRGGFLEGSPLELARLVDEGSA